MSDKNSFDVTRNQYNYGWPNVHPDWPHYRYWHHWNDSEPAALVPWNAPCCPPSADECVCVTYQDINMWNTISAVSAFAKIDFDAINGLTALSGLSQMVSAALIVGDNYEMWSSAQYVPNIYGQLSAISAKVDQKEYISATSSYLSSIYSDPNYFAGSGTRDSVLRLAPQARIAIEKVLDVTYAGSGNPSLESSYPWTLVTNKECDEVKTQLTNMFSSIQFLYNKIKELEIEIKALKQNTNTNTDTTNNNNNNNITFGTIELTLSENENSETYNLLVAENTNTTNTTNTTNNNNNNNNDDNTFDTIELTLSENENSETYNLLVAEDEQ